MIRARRRGLAIAVSALVGVAALSGVSLAKPLPALACSCAQLGTLREYATQGGSIFSGTAGPQDGRGVPVAVDRWFVGAGAAPVVHLSNDSFGEGSGCGINVPAAGSRWIWVAFRSPPNPDFQTGLCSPHGELGADDGRAHLAEARRTWGGAAPPAPAATDVEAPTARPAQTTVDETGMAIYAWLAVVSVVLFGGAIVIATIRSSRRDGKSG